MKTLFSQRAARALLAAGALLLAGCNLDITRTRTNKPLDQEAYRKLEPGRSTKEDALETLGAPDRVEYKPGLDLEYLWWLHRDDTRVGLRLQSPISFFGIRPTFAELDLDAEDTDAIQLVFEDGGLLQQKSLKLAPAYQTPALAGPAWAVYLLPRYSYSLFLFGDAGDEDYGDLFSSGQLFGGHLGLMPAPYFMLLLGGNVQTYQGDSFSTGGAQVSVDDLDLYQLEVGGRFQLPPEFFVSFWDVQKLKTLFYTDDVSRHRGFFLYFQWTVGLTWNEEVEAKVNGAPAGSFFDESLVFSDILGIGAEYRWARLGVHAGLDYQSIGAFEEGDTPVDNDADTFRNFLLSAGLSWRF